MITDGERERQLGAIGTRRLWIGCLRRRRRHRCRWSTNRSEMCGGVEAWTLCLMRPPALLKARDEWRTLMRGGERHLRTAASDAVSRIADRLGAFEPLAPSVRAVVFKSAPTPPGERPLKKRGIQVTDQLAKGGCVRGKRQTHPFSAQPHPKDANFRRRSGPTAI